MTADKSKVKIAFLSTYPPRECGIATFAKSFAIFFDELYLKHDTKIIAVSDEKGKYKYPKQVVFEIDQFDAASYAQAAKFVNESDIEVVSVQHEYGIYGGQDGKFILKFLENVNKPVVTSFHSVLAKEIHSEHRYKLTQRIIDLSNTIVVMTQNSKEILLNSFKVSESKIKVIPHGVPNVRFDQKEEAKKLFKLSGKTVLTTFGLINSGKGIELGIEAMASIVKKFPNVVYLIIGATHPDIKKKEGEKYRNSLIKLVKKYKLDDNIKFVNKYLEYKELVDYLKATDVYVALHYDLNQSFSGSISYALGCGAAICSTPTKYSQEVVDDKRGILCSTNVKEISEKLINLLSNSKNLKDTQFKAYQYARKMIWPQVALDYLRALEERIYLKTSKWKKRLPVFSETPSLKYLKTLTDDFGIVQHAVVTKPDYRFGYSLDDQARALIVCVKYLQSYPDAKNKDQVTNLLKIYLDYLDKAVDEEGIIHNFIDKDKKYADRYASEDSVARSFWALSFLIKSKLSNSLTSKAKKLLKIYKDKLTNKFVKTISYNILGYYSLDDKDEISKLADVLVQRFEYNSKEFNWYWFEEGLTWGNAIVPYCLIKAYRLTKKRKYLNIAKKSIDFLERVSVHKGTISVIGQDGWYFKFNEKAIFDQQPIDVADMVLMYNELYETVGQKQYLDKATEWIGWYFGNNINQIMIYDDISRGIKDGLTRQGVNENQGAESIVTYLMAYMSFIEGL